MAYYINFKYPGEKNETIDEFDSAKEAYKMLKEYQLAYGGHGRTWVSTRACKNWRTERERQMAFKRNQMSNQEEMDYIKANEVRI